MPSDYLLRTFRIVVKDLKSPSRHTSAGILALPLESWSGHAEVSLSFRFPHLCTGAVLTALMRSGSSRVLLNKLPPCHSALLLLLLLRSGRECKEPLGDPLAPLLPGNEKSPFPLVTTAPGDHFENLQKP